MKLWSRRWTPARGAHWQLERECLPETAQAWLAVFQADEPDIRFQLSEKAPRRA